MKNIDYNKNQKDTNNGEADSGLKISGFDSFYSAWDEMESLLFSKFEYTKWLGITFVSWFKEIKNIGLVFIPFIIIIAGFFVTFPSLAEVFPADLVENPEQISQSEVDKLLSDASDVFIKFLKGAGAVLITFFIIFLSFTGLITMWLRARFNFIFLDNIVKNRFAVKKPWSEWSVQGNSLFLWMLFMALVWITVFGISMIVSAVQIAPCIQHKLQNPESELNPLFIKGLLNGVLIFIISAFAVMLINFIFKHYAVPIMYKRKSNSFRAFSKALSLVISRPVIFLKYIFWIFLLNIAMYLLMIVVMCLTASVCWILIEILTLLSPGFQQFGQFVFSFIFALLFLPVTVFMRYFNLSFIAAYGKKFNVFQS